MALPEKEKFLGIHRNSPQTSHSHSSDILPTHPSVLNTVQFLRSKSKTKSPMLDPHMSDTQTSQSPAARHSENYRWRKAFGKNLIVKVANFVKSLTKKQRKHLEACGITISYLSRSKSKVMKLTNK
ncbi:hypothetical protein PoB_001746300 [Plakobranchus ocellatus]|uniref:Uncharacterized protein n=1 Tax=Plakobranchus ocellatus TaxID=259542 RepID=A0AAV3Z8I7_9GAST|nr:hypothetical protein PoB_001746300 [Plakobranchus ocellatus]